MANLMPSGITDEVLDILKNAGWGKGDGPQYITAYQILERLPDAVKQRLVAERGQPGAGSGHHYAAASVVSDAAEMLKNQGLVEIEYMDCTGLELSISGTPIVPGYPVCGLYRVVEDQ